MAPLSLQVIGQALLLLHLPTGPSLAKPRLAGKLVLRGLKVSAAHQ
jgi:hypothetical protein